MNTMITLYDELSMKDELPIDSTSSKHGGVWMDKHEAARLQENVAFWREKVDLLLQEKKESL